MSDKRSLYICDSFSHCLEKQVKHTHIHPLLFDSVYIHVLYWSFFLRNHCSPKHLTKISQQCQLQGIIRQCVGPVCWKCTDANFKRWNSLAQNCFCLFIWFCSGPDWLCACYQYSRHGKYMMLITGKKRWPSFVLHLLLPVDEAETEASGEIWLRAHVTVLKSEHSLIRPIHWCV